MKKYAEIALIALIAVAVANRVQPIKNLLG